VPASRNSRRNVTRIPRWLNPRPAAGNGPHRGRSPCVSPEVPAREEPPDAAAAFVDYAAPHHTERTFCRPSPARRAFPAFASLLAGLPHMPMRGCAKVITGQGLSIASKLRQLIQGDSKIADGSRMVTMGNRMARGVRCAAARTVL
jgi:hypothetical protein